MATPTPILVRMRHAEGIRCSLVGQAYEPDVDGVIWVPHEAVGEKAHGFVVWSENAAPAATALSLQAAAEPRCAHCGGPLDARRATKKFCSGRCRVAALRRRRLAQSCRTNHINER
jgi:hypothetical protein